MRILISAYGSHGDTLPFVGLGKALRDRGHDVRAYASAYHAPLVREAGLAVSPIGTVEDYVRGISDPDLNHPTRGLRAIARLIEKDLRSLHDAMAVDIVPGNTAIVAGVMGFPARSVAEVHKVPVAMVHLQPVFFRSNHAMPRMGASTYRPPDVIKPLGWWLMDRLGIDPALGKVVNRHRAELGLRPVSRLFHEWIHHADVLIGMFPEWFGPRQPDWPSHLRQTGFPLYDHSHTNTLPAAVAAFLAAGEAPVAFTAGTASAASHEFYAVSVEACRQSGRRGILVTPHTAQVPSDLPASVARFDYVAFSALLPHVAAFVHHGGMGTTSQAFRAGVPQLIRPMSHDQFDNSERAQRLGVARELLTKDYKVAAVVAALDQLTTDAALRSRCAEVARSVETDGIAVACDRILDGVQAWYAKAG